MHPDKWPKRPIRDWLCNFCYNRMHESTYFGDQWNYLFELFKPKEWKDLEASVRKLFPLSEDENES